MNELEDLKKKIAKQKLGMEKGSSTIISSSIWISIHVIFTWIRTVWLFVLSHLLSPNIIVL